MSNATPSRQPRKGLRTRLIEKAERKIWSENDRLAELNGWRVVKASLFVRRYRDPRFDRLGLDPDGGAENVAAGSGGTHGR
ncbi:hypothetical protein Pta02_42810 [Planobispora takensis]|uniref:Uncharacterized protein n=1 Tax=Planobispora takensis TaxID=1367882 RepID=A0A8J3WV36_9ACTN|nr:hypothetical protein Pta02_42810 [Planobispora takensis]